jgi:hypothetical protein
MAAPTSGKWYWETTVTSLSGAAGFVLGIYDPNNSNQAVGANLNVVGVAYYSVDGTKYVSGVNTAYGATFGTNDVIGVALNADSGTVAFYKNNTSQGSITLPSSVGGWIFQAQGQGGSNSAVVELNFGQRPFTYTPPTGFVALNTYNLPASTITNGAAYMAATTYTGTGASLTVANTVGSTSFQPDWVWVKGRSGATDHALYDSVRGVQKQIESNTTTAETTETTGLTAFGSTGFTVGALAQMNTSSATYVAWQWKAGTTSASNTSGILTSQVSANTTAGFSVCTYTAPASSQANSFGHGLGVAPSMVIAKNRSSGTGGLGWAVYHSSLGANQVLSLNTTAASATVSGYWGSGMTSTVVGLPTCASSTGFDNCTGNMVAYCFSAVAGYSAFGSFVGNGTQGAGPFVFLGFRPRYVLIKNINGAYDWHCFDTSRGQYNYSGSNILKPNASDAELTARNDVQIDFLSNGFRLIGNDIGINQNGSTHIYITFAENPFRNALAF